jgi:type II secretory ATPase GspE/PulE/Tfp pilus assembly ATPase PilB-like protein
MVTVVSAPGSLDPKNEQAQAVLKKLRQSSIEEVASQLAQNTGFPYIDLHIFPIGSEDVLLIPEADAHRLHLTLFHKKGLQARFAILDPKQTEVLDYIKTLSTSKGWEAEIYVVSEPSLNRAFEQYKRRTFIDNLDLVRVELADTDLEAFDQDFQELLSLKESRTVNTSRAMEIVLAGARKLDASDIHFETEEHVTRLRFRIDGVLQDIGDLPLDIYKLLLSRVKMLGKMRLNIRKEAQDGHFYVDIEGKRIDIRVNSIPGKFGESINMRLLSSEDIIVDVDQLGLRGLAQELVMKEIRKPHGMILNTGPTGSGKTTTLYTLLSTLNEAGTKIITIEDPIEYSLNGIVQTEVSKDHTYTFATALRAIVRQDPDIVLVGEIRDDETADIAVNAALTGHLLFSTLHANSAAAAIPRFIELGVKPSLITSAMNIIIAQRLVRKLCPHCKTSYEPAKETLNSITKLITIISPKAKVSLPQNVKELWQAGRCQRCHMTGYKGRIGIFEVLTMTPEISEIISNLGSEEEIFKAALENGMITMTQDGILKALEGITTLDEVWRVADQTEILQNVYAKLMPSELSRASLVTETLYAETKQHLSSLEAFAQFVAKQDSALRLPTLFAAAVAMKAGDIHIEPTEKTFEIRFRIDGILKTVATFPLNEYPGFMGEIKLLGGLKAGEVAGVTDSRFSINFEQENEHIDGKKVDIRLSIILGGFGETVVMRLLNQSATQLDLDVLHIRKQSLDRLIAAIEKPYGMILNTGPTGSGKTTTLYSILARLNKPEIKIITVEDPIEYQIPGLLQTQTNEEAGYTFATALRALMRQNPDILMIGEIRDDETAEIAVQSASTGHLVLSTLHANSAAGTVSRLLKMNISGDDLANAGNLFMAQRLVRRLCDTCKQASAPTTEESALIEKILASIAPTTGVDIPASRTLWREAGCPQCNGTGYTGRMTITEAMPLDKDIQELISRGALVHEIEEKAIENGMVTLAQDGILTVLEGLTSLEEIKRVTEI